MKKLMGVLFFILIALIPSMGCYAELENPYVLMKAEDGDFIGTSFTQVASDSFNYVSVNPQSTSDLLSLVMDIPFDETYEFWVHSKGTSTATLGINNGTTYLAQEALQFTMTEWGWRKIATTLQLTAGRYYFHFYNFTGPLDIDQVIATKKCDAIPPASGAPQPPSPSTKSSWTEDGLNPFGIYSKNNGEFVDPTSGVLALVVKDVDIPGRGGANLTLSRLYRSRVNSLSRKLDLTYLGYEWEFAIPKITEWTVFFPDGTACYLDDKFYRHETKENDVKTITYENVVSKYFKVVRTETKGLLWSWNIRDWKVYLADGSVWEFDAEGRILSMKSYNQQNKLDFGYDTNKKLVSITDNLGRKITIDRTSSTITIFTEINSVRQRVVTYNILNSKIASVSDVSNRLTSYQYEDGGINKITYPNGQVSYYTYEDNSFDFGLFHTFMISDHRVCLTDSNNVEKNVRKTHYSYTYPDDSYYEHRHRYFILIKETEYGYDSNQTSLKKKTTYYNVGHDSRLLNRQKIIDETTSSVIRTIYYKWDHLYRKTLEETYGNVYDGFDNHIQDPIVGTSGPERNTTNRLYFEQWLYDRYGNLLYYKDPDNNETKYAYLNNEYPGFYGATTGIYEFYDNSAAASLPLHNLKIGEFKIRRYADDRNQNPEGIEVYYQYDNKGQLIESKNLLIDDNQRLWDKTKYTAYDIYGNCTQMIYDVDGKPVQVDFQYAETDPFTGTQYKGAYLTKKIQRVSQNVVDDTGKQLFTPQEVEITYSYDLRTGNVTVERYPGGNTRIYDYDQLGRLIKVTYPDLSYESVIYDDNNRLAKMIDSERKNMVIHHFDSLGREIQVDYCTYSDTTPNTYTVLSNTKATYNWLDKVETSTDQNSLVTKYEFDPFGRLIKLTTPDNKVTSTIYYDSEFKSVLTDPAGRTITTITNKNGLKLSEKIESKDKTASNTSTYQYDHFGNVTKTVDGNGNEMGYEYNNQGKLSKVEYPGPGGKVYGDYAAGFTEYNYYDTRGNLRQTIDRNHNVISYSYNEYNQLTERTLPNSGSIKHYYNKLGRLILDEWGSYTKLYTYDIMGRVSQEQTKVDGKTFNLSYGYNKNSNVTQMTYPGSLGTLTYNYGNLNRISDMKINTTPLVSSVNYSSDNLINSINFGNGVVGNFTYTNINGKTLTKSIDYLEGTLHLGVFNYTYDVLGNLLQANDNLYNYNYKSELNGWQHFKENDQVLLGNDLLINASFANNEKVTLDNTVINQDRLQLAKSQYTDIINYSGNSDLYVWKGTNLLPNGAFEEGVLNTIGIPQWWEVDPLDLEEPSLANSIQLVRTSLFNQSVKISCSAGHIYAELKSNPVTVVPGESYRLSGWVLGASNARMTFGIAWYNGDTLISQNYIASDAIISAWSYYEQAFTAPADATTCRVILSTGKPLVGFNGSGYFDNIILVPDTGPGYNLIPENSAFESSTLGAIGLPTGWVINPFPTSTSGISIVSDTAMVSSTKAVKLDNTQLTSGSNLGIESIEIPVNTSKMYKLAGWVKGSGTANLDFGVAWFDNSNNKISNSFLATGVNPTGWVYYEGLLSVPANAVKCRIWCANMNTTSGAGLFDNIILMENTLSNNQTNLQFSTLTNTEFDAEKGYVLTHVPEIITEDFKTPAHIAQSDANIVNGIVSLPVNTIPRAPVEVFHLNYQLPLIATNINRPLASLTQPIVLEDYPYTNPDSGDVFIPSTECAWIEGVKYEIPQNQMQYVRKIKINYACTVKNHYEWLAWDQYEVWVMVKVNGHPIDYVQFCSAGYNSKTYTDEDTFDLTACNLQLDKGSTTIQLFWLVHPRYRDFTGATIDQFTVTAVSESVYPVNQTTLKTISIDEQFGVGKTYHFGAMDTVPTGSTIRYELKNALNQVVNLSSNNCDFTVQTSGLYNLNAYLTTNDKGVTPVITDIAISEVPAYVKQASVQLQSIALPFSSGIFEITSDVNIPTGCNVDFWVSENYEGTQFVKATRSESGKYYVQLSTPMDNLILRTTLWSDASQSSTPTVGLTKVCAVDAGTYNSTGTITTQNFVVNAPVNRLILEVLGLKNGGNISASLLSGGQTINGVARTLSEISGDPTYYTTSANNKVNLLKLDNTDNGTKVAKVTSMRAQSLSLNMQSYYFTFDIPANLAASDLTAQLTITLSAPWNLRTSPVFHNFTLFKYWEGYKTEGTFSMSTPIRQYSFDDIKVDSANTRPSGTSINFEIGNLGTLTSGQSLHLSQEVNSFSLLGTLSTIDNTKSPSIDRLYVYAIGETPIKNNLDTLSAITPTTGVTLSTDRIYGFGANSLELNNTSIADVVYTLSTQKFDATKLPMLEIWIKPLNTQTQVSFTTLGEQQNEVKIGNDKNADGIFKINEDLVAGTWNLILLDVSKTLGGTVGKHATGLKLILKGSGNVRVLGLSSLPWNNDVIKYDENGNRTEYSINNHSITKYCFGSVPNRITEKYTYLDVPTAIVERVIYRYDNNGNMIYKETYKQDGDDEYYDFTYNELNQLTEVRKNGVLQQQYAYNDKGLRVKVIDYVGRQTTYYIFGTGNDPIYEETYDNSNLSTPVRKYGYFFMGSTRIAQIDGSSKLKYYYNDKTASTRITYKPDSIIKYSTLEYSPFGEVLRRGDFEKYTFAGKEQDLQTGLYYFNARYYDPTMGRFISEDVSKDGENWSVYSLNNPLKYIDPDGYRVGWFDLSFQASKFYGIEGGFMLAVDDKLNMGLFFHVGGVFQFGHSLSTTLSYNYAPAMPTIFQLTGPSFSAGASIPGKGGGVGLSGGKYFYTTINIASADRLLPFRPIEGHVVFYDHTWLLSAWEISKKDGWQKIKTHSFIGKSLEFEVKYTPSCIQLRLPFIDRSVVISPNQIKLFLFNEGDKDNGKLLNQIMLQ